MFPKNVMSIYQQNTEKVINNEQLLIYNLTVNWELKTVFLAYHSYLVTRYFFVTYHLLLYFKGRSKENGFARINKRTN